MAIRVRPRKTTSDPTPLQAVADRHLSRLALLIGTALDRVRRSGSFSDGVGAFTPDWSRFWDVRKDSADDVFFDLIVDGAGTESHLFGGLRLVAAVQAAREMAATLVLGISEESRLALRQVTAEAMSGAYTPRQAATLIRQTVGLTGQQAQAVVNYRNALAAVGEGRIPEGVLDDFTLADPRYRYVTPDRVDDLVSRYADRALRQRAETIARTETITAAHRGQRALWDQAAGEGYFDPATAKRVWVTTEDDRSCAECMSLDGAEIDYHGTFSSGRHTAEHPALHPRCRCTTSLLFD